MDAIVLRAGLSGRALVGAGAFAFFQDGQRAVHTDKVGPQRGEKPDALVDPSSVDEHMVGGHVLAGLRQGRDGAVHPLR